MLISAAAAAKSLQSCLTLWDHMDYSLLGSSVHRFSRQEYWSGLPFPPTQGSNPHLLRLLNWQEYSLPLRPRAMVSGFSEDSVFPLPGMYPCGTARGQWDRIDGIFTDHPPSDSLPLFFLCHSWPLYFQLFDLFSKGIKPAFTWGFLSTGPPVKY